MKNKKIVRNVKEEDEGVKAVMKMLAQTSSSCHDSQESCWGPPNDIKKTGIGFGNQ